MYRIMIADDEIIIREGLTNFINWEKLNCSVEYVAGNGIDAFDYLQKNSVDIIITDIRMPGKSGLDIAQFIYDNKLATKIIILSGYSEFQYAQKALQTGAVDFILKNNPLEKVESAVLKAIDELEKLEKNITLLQDMKKSMIQKEEELRIKFYLDLINDVPISNGELDEKVKQFCNISSGVYCILFKIKIIDNTEKIDNSFINSVIKFLNTVFTANKPTVFPLLSNTVCMVLNDVYTLSEMSLILTFKQLFALIENYRHYKMKIVVSAVHDNIIDLNKAYLECCYCLKHNAASHKKIFFYKDETIAASPNFNPVIKKAIRYIENNYNNQITLLDIADHVGLNPSYFSRIFKKETNDSITGYLAKYRIEKAKELITDESLRLSEIAEAVGYNDVSYFSNIFKKITGYSPTDYRTIICYKTGEL